MRSEYVVALYMRISDEDEELIAGSESESITGQRLILREFVELHPKISKSRIMEFIDDGYSGTDFERPAFQSMLDKVKMKEVHCIVVKDFSRLGRNYLEVGNYLEQIFPFLGVRFFSINDHFDSCKDYGAAGSIDVAFKNIIHEAYSKDLSVKIKSSKRAMAEQGKFVTAFAPYGYEKSKEDKNKLVIDECCADTVRKIYQLYLEGKRQVEIARLLNQADIPSPLMVKKSRNQNFHSYQCNSKCYWTASTIAKILTDERYMGTGVYGKLKPKTVGSKKDIKAPKEEWIVVPNAHQGIIGEQTFLMVQQQKRKHKYNKKEDALLIKKVYCKGCNHALARKRNRKGVSYLKCPTWQNIDSFPCYKGTIKEEMIEITIITYLRQVTLLLKEQEVLGTKHQERQTLNTHQLILQLEDQIKKERLSIFTMYEGFKTNKISKAMIQEKMAGSTQLLKELEYKRLSLQYEEENEMKNQLEEKEDAFTRFVKYNPFTELTRDMVEEFIEKINVDSEGGIEIFWKFNSDFLDQEIFCT